MSEDADFIRRQCSGCEKRITTYEQPDVTSPPSSKKMAGAPLTSTEKFSTT
jgi:transcriptional regulator NrdR family protein